MAPFQKCESQNREHKRACSESVVQKDKKKALDKIELLLNFGADALLKDESGISPLTYARNQDKNYGRIANRLA